MDPKKNDSGRDMTVNDLISAISMTEYPQYILDALSRIQGWMRDSINAPANRGIDPFCSRARRRTTRAPAWTRSLRALRSWRSTST